MKYFYNKGEHTNLIKKCWDKFVPFDGAANTILGEVVRSFGRINYDIGNNGACNLVNDDGDRICDYSIYFFRTLEEQNVISERLSHQLKLACIKKANQKISFEEIGPIIDEVGDKVGAWIKTNYPEEC